MVLVYDITGRKVFENSFENTSSTVSIKMENVISGIYSVVVKNNEDVSSKKIIIN
jgi:hypothetical protein